MKRKLLSKRMFAIIWFAVGLVIFPLHFAHAYLDPGTGSYAVQVVIGLIFGIGYVARSFGSNIARFFKGKKGGSNRDK